MCLRVALGTLPGQESDGKEEEVLRGGGKAASSSMHSHVSSRRRLIKQYIFAEHIYIHTL